MLRLTRRYCDFLVLESERRWSRALLRAAAGLEEPARGGFPPERSADRLRSVDSLSRLDSLLIQAPASVVAIECEAVDEEEFVRFLAGALDRASDATWIRLGTDGRRPTRYVPDWTWVDTAASIASSDRLWRVRRRVLERLAPDAADPQAEMLRALPWKSASDPAEERHEPTA